MDTGTKSTSAVLETKKTHHEPEPRPAHSLREAAESENPVEGYAAMNIPADQIDQHEEIARLAYSYFEARGGEHGSHEEDWHRAHQEIRGRGTKG
jgi:hypothetical protein